MEAQHDTTDYGPANCLSFEGAALAGTYALVEAAVLDMPPERQRLLMEGLETVDIQEALRKAIVKSRITHYRLGKDADIDAGIIDRFVNGERDIRLGTASKLAEVLGLRLVPKATRKTRKA